MYKFCPNCGQKISNPKADPIRCSNCLKTFYFNSKPTASVIPVYKDQILVSIRSKEPKKGGLDFIGGFLENGEEPLVGAVREFKEETGMTIKMKDLEYLGIWIDEYNYQETKYSIFNVCYIIWFNEKHELNPKDDISELIWVPLNKEHKFAFKSEIKTIKYLRKYLQGR